VLDTSKEWGPEVIAERFMVGMGIEVLGMGIYRRELQSVL